MSIALEEFQGLPTEKARCILIFLQDRSMSATMEEIGIGIIASLLRENGYSVILMADYLEDFDYDRILTYNPQYIGFTVYKSSNKIVAQTIKRLKAQMPDATIFIGGVHATSSGVSYMEENDAIDFAVMGEGEHTILELLEKHSKGKSCDDIKGLIYRKEDAIVKNESRTLIKDLDTLPFAARDIYKEKKMRVAVVSGSRGCIARCDFCATQMFWQRWRGRSCSSILDEIEYLIREYHVSAINFIDCSFEDPYNDLRRMKEFAEGILERNIRISYFADFRAEFHRKVSGDIMMLLKDSGLSTACVGIEAANDMDLKLYNKKATADDNYAIMDLFKAHDIGLSPGFICFNPTSTLEKFRKNLDFLTKYGYPIKVFTSLSVYEGTRLFKVFQEKNLLLPDENGNFQYQFEDELTGKLAKYMFDFCMQLDREHDEVHKYLVDFLDTFSFLLDFYKATFRIHKDEKMQQYFAEFIMGYENIKQSFNDILSQWIYQLIEHIDLNWTYNDFLAFSKDIMPIQECTDAVKRFKAFERKLYYILEKNGYGEYITRI